ncbi:MAG: hypothetical protein AAF810_06910 [Cyanobacteria bacterium P01_D01_bin.36]
MHLRRARLNWDEVLRVVSATDIRAAASGDRIGLCVKCGHEHGFIPTDATHWYCEICGDYGLYSAKKLQTLLQLKTVRRKPRNTQVFHRAMSALANLVKLKF